MMGNEIFSLFAEENTGHPMSPLFISFHLHLPAAPFCPSLSPRHIRRQTESEPQCIPSQTNSYKYTFPHILYQLEQDATHLFSSEISRTDHAGRTAEFGYLNDRYTAVGAAEAVPLHHLPQLWQKAFKIR